MSDSNLELSVSATNENVIGTKGPLDRRIWFLEYVLFLFIILEFNSAYTEYERLRSLLLYGSLGVVFFLLVLTKTPFKLNGLIILYLIGSFLPLLNVWPGQEKRFIKLYWLVIPFFMLYLSSLRRIDFNRIIAFLLKFSNVVAILAVISLAYWVLGSNLHVISPTMYVPNTWKGNGIELIPTYHFLYFETQESSFMGYETVRNSGIFNEGPMYNMILCVALSMELFLRPKKSFLRILILGLTIATTFTTTGILFLGLMMMWIVYYFFSERAKFYLTIIIPLLIICAMNFSSAVIEDKETSGGEGSLRSRTYDILTCIEIGMENPLLGQGLFTKKLSEASGGSYGYSNSIFTLFADGGFYTVFLYFSTLILIPLRHYLKNRELLWPLMMFSYFFVFSITISQYTLLTLLFIAFGLIMFEQTDEAKQIRVQ